MPLDNPFEPGAASVSPQAALDFSPVPLEVGSVLQRSYALVLAQPRIVLGSMSIVATVPLVAIALDLALEFGLGVTGSAHTYASQAPDISARLLAVFLQIGLIRVLLAVARGQPADVGMLFGETESFFGGVWQTFLLIVGVIAGLVCFVFPGVVAAVGLQFGLILLVDRGLEPVRALSASWALTEGVRLPIFAINLVTGLVLTSLACVTLGVGFVFMAPVLVLTQVVMYQSLMATRGDEAAFQRVELEDL